MPNRLAHAVVLYFAAAALSACVSVGKVPVQARPTRTSTATTAQPQERAGVYKIGAPYQIAGVWYYPHEEADYDATGIASWYGADFHGMVTANGEVFDRNALTAAHPTLPMPVNVRVTNLENGHSLVVRVNDRGPYVNGRIIDMSERAADLLGFKVQGTARVRVTYLGRANLNGGGLAPPPQETPPEIATAVPPAPTEKIAGGELPPVAGVRIAPPAPVESSPLPAPQPAAVTAGPTPDGKVTVVQVPAMTAIYVQAGAYASLANASRVVARLKSVGAHISQIAKEGRPLYRVRVGPFQDVGQADATLDQVHALGQNDVAIVVD